MVRVRKTVIRHMAVTGQRRAIRLVGIATIVVLAAGAMGVLYRQTEKNVASNSKHQTPVPTSAENQADQIAAAATEPASITMARDWRKLDDPAADGWNTEVFAAAAASQLDQLGEGVVHPERIEAKRVGALAAVTFACSSLRPQTLKTVIEDDVFRVERKSRGDNALDRFRGSSGLVKAIRQLAAPLDGATDVRFKFNIFRVNQSANTVTTRQYFQLSGRTAEGMMEENATWLIHWQPGTEVSPPLLESIEVQRFERVSTRHPAGPLLADCTSAVLGGTDCFENQLLRGFNHWLERIQDNRYLSLFGTPGLAIGDVNSDGLDDLYLCQEEGLPNLLLIQNADGTARNAADWGGVNWYHDSRSALLVDLDNDGDQDLVVAMKGSVVVAENDGSGRFAIRAVLPTSNHPMSMCAADYDSDGDLDFYVCCYRDAVPLNDQTGPNTFLPTSDFVLHDANDGAPNQLFRNDISTVSGTDWGFTDVTKEVSLDVNNRRYSLAAAWEDYDNDGDQDLYVANDYGRDNLYRNDGNRFTEISAESGAEDSAYGMSVTWGDYNRDGRMDVFIANMWSAAGNRIAYQEKFKTDSPGEVKRRIQRMARGNTLLSGLDDGTFRNVSGPTGIEVGRWAWSANFVDIDNNGWEDLVVANGYITGVEDSGVL